MCIQIVSVSATHDHNNTLFTWPKKASFWFGAALCFVVGALLRFPIFRFFFFSFFFYVIVVRFRFVYICFRFGVGASDADAMLWTTTTMSDDGVDRWMHATMYVSLRDNNPYVCVCVCVCFICNSIRNKASKCTHCTRVDTNTTNWKRDGKAQVGAKAYTHTHAMNWILQRKICHTDICRVIYSIAVWMRMREYKYEIYVFTCK